MSLFLILLLLRLLLLLTHDAYYPLFRLPSPSLPLQTGKSKHYGFIEYSSSAVAEIVAETMDNYLLCGHILRCKLVPKEEVHPKLWIGANRKFRRVPRERVERLQQNKVR